MSDKKVYTFVIKNSAIQLPRCCVSCMGPVDSSYPVVGRRTFTGKDYQDRAAVTADTITLNLPYCHQCELLASQVFPLERLFNISKYVQIPVSLILVCLGMLFLSRILPEELNQQWYFGLPQLILILGTPIVLFFLFKSIATRSVPDHVRDARARARIPAGWTVIEPYTYQNILYIRNKTWADMFGEANNLVAGLAEIPFN